MGRTLAKDVISADTGEVLAVANSEITEELLAQFDINDVQEIQTLYINDLDQGGYISATLHTMKLLISMLLGLLFTE